LKGMVFRAGRGWGQRTSFNTILTGSGAGGGRSATNPMSSIIIGTLWVVVSELFRVGRGWGQRASINILSAGSGAGGGRIAVKPLSSITSTQGMVCGCCGLLVMLCGGGRWGAFSSRSSSWENCWLTVSSSPMTRRNSGPPAGTTRWSSSSSTLQVRAVLAALALVWVEGPYLSRN